MNNVLIDDKTFPLSITFEKETYMPTVISWYKENIAYIESKLLEKGAIVVQGAGIDTIAKFEEFTGGIATKFRNYVDGNYHRRNLKGHVYISTEYDPKFDITMHNELSYSTKWPTKLFFGCIIPPGEGGETPLADSRAICKSMDKNLLDEFERKGVKYIRNLHSGAGMGPSWQQTFETEDTKVVESLCDEMTIKYYWKPDGGIRLENIRPATRMHPLTQEKVWFNQVDQYHPSHFPEEVYDALMLLADGNEEELPLYSCFGDGTRIDESIIKEVIHTMDKEVVKRPWKKGDFVIVENMLVAHGRKAYKGDRQIVVSMAQN